MKHYFTEIAFFALFAFLFSCMPSYSDVEADIAPIELFVFDSILGTVSSVSAGENAMLVVIDALSRQYLYAYEFFEGDSFRLIERGYIARDEYGVRDVKFYNGLFYVVEGLDGVLVVRKNGSFEAAGRIMAPDTGVMFFDVAEGDEGIYCACGEEGVIKFMSRHGAGGYISYFAVDTIRCEGSASHVSVQGDLTAVGLWDVKKVCLFKNGILTGVIEGLKGIAGLAIEGERLYVASEQGGLLIYGISESGSFERIKEISEFPAYDVELCDGKIFVAADIEGLKVYDLNGRLIAFCDEASPAEKVSSWEGLVFVSHAMQIPKGYLWIIQKKDL
ncbi:hypothetical protein JW890_03130 [candidate division WOR-3 bacterium]|nr:hypothetical protein [candidate division WOR-3 bacterium]